MTLWQERNCREVLTVQRGRKAPVRALSVTGIRTGFMYCAWFAAGDWPLLAVWGRLLRSRIMPSNRLGLDDVPLPVLALENIFDDHTKALISVFGPEIHVRQRLIAINGYLLGFLVHGVNVHA